MQNKHKSSVFTFLVLVFTLSLPFWVLGAIYPFQLLPGLPLSALQAFTPAFGALVLTYRSGRLAGVLQLLQRSFDFKRLRNPYWFVIILLLNPVIGVLAYLIIGTVSEPLPTPAPVTPTLLPMVIFFFIGALGEEIGWSGYATEPLQQRWGTVTASLMLGAIWAIWHFVPLVQADRTVEWIAWWSLGTIALRLIMTWLYVHSGQSVFAAAVFHAMINLSWQLFPNNGSLYDPRVFGLITLGLAVILYAIDRFRSPGKLQAT